MNKIVICGRLGEDPQMRQAKDANVTTFTVAETSIRKGADGKPVTNWFRCSAWRGLGETCAKYLHKGDGVTIIGDLVQRSYKDKSGADRTSLEVTVSDMAFGQRKSDEPIPSTPQPHGGDDELPF